MLRVLLVADPLPEQAAAVADALAPVPLSGLYVSPVYEAAGADLGRRHSLAPVVESQLDDGDRAIGLVKKLAEGEEGTVALVADASVVWAVVVDALDAPVPRGRIALDPGSIAEVEVRLDAPWTVNRINDGCHLGAA